MVPLFDACRQFDKQASDPQSARVFLRDKFNHGESVVFLASQGPTPVGFTQLFPSFSLVSMARVFLLNDLFVAPLPPAARGGRCVARRGSSVRPLS